MFVQRSLGALRPAALARAASASCGAAGAAPPCPPCPPRAPPPCRAPRPSAPPGVREVCCPPRRPPPPPCPPASCTLTCGNMTRKSDEAPRHDQTLHASGGLDCVAWRHRCARRTRQLDYEREVASRAAAPAPCGPPAAPYALGAERELARATDGHLYAISRSDAPPMHCSSTGESPPPRPVKLEEPNARCHIGDDHLDPCAHQPRIFREIDRTSAASQHTGGSASPEKSCASEQPETGIEGGARRAGDFGWCKNPPSFPGAPQRCRPLTVVERLRAHPAPRTPGPGARRLHTSVVASAPAGAVHELKRLKERLQEAGRGRVVLGNCAPRPMRPKPLEGKLDMCVPPGTSRVCVRVYLDGADCSPDTKTQTSGTRNEIPHLNSNCQNQMVTSACKINESWLSIKSIQKKLSCGPDAKVATLSNEGRCGSQHKLPPARPRPACVDSPRRPECPRPSSPPAPAAPSAPAASDPPCGPKRCKSSPALLVHSVVADPSW